MQTSLLILTPLLLLALSWWLLPGHWSRLLSRAGRRACGMSQATRTVNGVRWNYLQGGSGPTLVLLHGLIAEADHWLPTARELCGDFQLLIPDLPGFGESQPPAGLDFRIHAQAERLADWLDALGVERCMVAGNSMGGWIAADYAAHHPDRVQALWLQDPFGVLSARPSEMLTKFEKDEANPFEINSMADYRDLMALLFEKKPWIPGPILRTGLKRALHLKSIMPRMQSEILKESEPMESLASRLHMPVFVQWGAADRALDQDGMSVLASRLDQPETDLLENTGHLPMLEQPLRSARAFRAFCQRQGLIAESARA